MSKMHKGAPKIIFQRATDLRNASTHAEEILWNYLKGKPLGFKFRRQHPYGLYILDFYCHAAKLVIEVDGPIHEKIEVREKDIERQQNIESDGLKVIRFSNDNVERNFGEVISILEELLKRVNNE